MSTISKSLDNVLNYSERLSAKDFDETHIKKDDLQRQYDTIVKIIEKIDSGMGTVMLADDVGMGKTYVALGIMANYLFNNRSSNSSNINNKKFLIITPQSKILQSKWAQEVRCFYENAGVKESAKKKIRMNPVIIDSVHSLLKLSIDVENREDIKQIREHSDFQMLFTYILYYWAYDRKVKFNGRLTQKYQNFGPFHNLKKNNDIIYFSSAYTMICEFSLRNYLDHLLEKEAGRVRDLLESLIEKHSWRLLNEEIKEFLKVQDYFEPNIFIIRMNRLKLSSKRTGQFQKILSTVIMNHALSGCEEKRRTSLTNSLFIEERILMPETLGNKKWCPSYLEDLYSFNSYLGIEEFLKDSVYFNENKSLFRRDKIDPNLFIKNVIKEFIDYRLKNAGFEMCVIDEVHNWKSGSSNNASDFKNQFASLFDKKLIMSATPIQLSIRELRNIFDVVSDENEELIHNALGKLFEEGLVDQLEYDSRVFKERWDYLTDEDYNELSGLSALVNISVKDLENVDHQTNSQTLRSFLDSVHKYRESVQKVEEVLSGFIVRHIKDAEFRSVQAGMYFDTDVRIKNKIFSTSGMNSISDEMTLFECMSMRLGQKLRKYDTSQGQNSTSARLLNGLNSSFEAYKASNLSKKAGTLIKKMSPEDSKYYDLHKKIVESADFEHPKVSTTVERAFDNWLKGEKTLIFCSRIQTIESLEQKVNRKIIDYLDSLGSSDFKIESLAKDYNLVDLRLFRVFLSSKGEDSNELKIMNALENKFEYLNQIFNQLGVKESSITRRKLYKIFDFILFKEFGGDDDLSNFLSTCLDGDNELLDFVAHYVTPPKATEKHFVNTARDEDDIDEDGGDLITDTVFKNAIEEYSRENSIWINGHEKHQTVCANLWRLISNEFEKLGPKGRHFIFDIMLEMFSGLLKVSVKREDLIIRYLATEGDGDNASKIISGLYEVKFGNESQIDKINNFLHDLYNAQGTINPNAKELTKRLGMWRGTFLKIGSYRTDEKKATPYVKRLTGSVTGDARLKICDAFNSPLPPDVLICTSVGAEGIDLHRYCRHVIHHDIPWNPASLEQKTGRIDRVNSLAERLNIDTEKVEHFINVGIPFLGNNYDQYQYDVLVERAQKFEVLFGDPEILEDLNSHMDKMEKESFSDDKVEDVEEEQSEHYDISRPLPESLIKYLSIDLSCHRGNS